MSEEFTLVRTETLLWLLGEHGTFECPVEQYFLGQPAPFFWRKALREAMLAAPQPAPSTGDERVAHGETEVSTVAEVMAECEAFEAAMVEAGFSRPALGRHIGMYRYRRDGDRFTGWKLARAAHRREDQRLTCDEFISAGYLNEISQPGFMHYPNIAPINAYVQRVVAAMQRAAAPAHGDNGAIEQGDAS